MALLDCRQLVSMVPTDELGRINTGLILQAMRKDPEAIVEFTSALRINAKNANALKFRAISYERLNQLAESSADCRAALQINPSDPQALALQQRLNQKSKP